MPLLIGIIVAQHFCSRREVRYLPIQKIVSYFEAFSEDDFVAEATNLFRDSMFMKRPEFDHEEEVRIILKLKTKATVLSEVVSLPITPKDVIEEITFDPRITDDVYQLLLSKLRLVGYDQIANKSNSVQSRSTQNPIQAEHR